MSCYLCKNCNGILIYNSIKKSFICDSCNTQYQKEDLQSLTSNKIQDDFIVCESCGASNKIDTLTTSLVCDYCKTPIIIDERISNIKFIIPPIINKQKALEIFKKWRKNHILAPNEFLSLNRLKKIKLTYIPYYFCNVNGNSNISVNCSTISRHIEGNYEITTTHNYEVFLSANFKINNFYNLADSKNSFNSFSEPFNITELNDFHPAYLNNINSYLPDKDFEYFIPQIKNEISNIIPNELLKNITEFQNKFLQTTDTSSNINNHSIAYMPVWLSSYKSLNGKDYFVILNAQTGKITGYSPISKIKLFILFLIFNIIFMLILSLL